MTMPLQIFVLVILTFSTRILPRLFLPNAFSTDTYYQMLVARSIRESHFKVPKTIRGFCFPGPFDYPPLFPFILAFFNDKAREKIEMYISPFIDIAIVLTAYFFSRYLIGFLMPVPLQETSLLAFCVSVVYAMSPALLFFGYGPRAYQATPRTLSELLFLLLVISEFGYFFNGSKPLSLLAVILCALIFLSSKFGVQIVLFFSLVMAVSTHSFYFLLIPLLGFAATAISTRGYYINVLKGQICHLVLFKKITSKVYPFIQKKNRMRDLITLPKDLSSDRKKAFGTIFFNNSFIIALTRNPQIVLLGLWFLIGKGGAVIASSPKAHFMMIWIISALVAFIITSLRPFLFLGEAERYITYSLMPQYVFLMLFIGYSRFSIQVYSALIIYSLLLYLAYVYLFIKWHTVDEGTAAAKNEVFDFLRKSREGLRVLPISEDTYELAYRSGQDVLYPPGNYRVDYVSPEEFKKLYEVFDSPNPDIGYIMDKYGLDTIFVSERQVGYLKKNFNIEYDFSKYRKVFQNDKFRVYGKE